jgi:hypothetical protein
MPPNWLREHVRGPKPPDYARRVLDGYRLGIRAAGAIRGVRILTGPDSCRACRALSREVHLPEHAPIIPIAACCHPDGCRCAYSPVMSYEDGDDAEPDGALG